MSKVYDLFTSRFGLIAATLGMAIGAGNIWRFPRLAGQYGGSFLIPWMIFLFLWSVPLLLVEFSVGKKTRKGVIGSFQQAIGDKFTWMGWFVVFCTSAIMFYYSVVCGWSLKYFILSISGEITQITHESYWHHYSASFFQPILYHFLALAVASSLIFLGVVRGIEKFSKIIIPTLYLLLIISAIKALSLEGSQAGVTYLFNIEYSSLLDYKIWLEGLSQSAWSTGAGWGLILTYAVYSRKNENVTGNVFITALGNNAASIFAGLAIIPTIFALSLTTESAQKILASGNQGLAFIAIPKLFTQMSSAGIFSTVFFLSLFFAALSSLISMLELASRSLMDFGWSRKKSILIIFITATLCGVPSAVSMDFFNNQDWVWGLGLLLSGLFFTLLVLKIGVAEFVNNWLRPKNLKRFSEVSFKILFYFLIPIEFMAMIIWWFFQSITSFSTDPWNIMESFSLGTVIFQWIIILLAGLFFNKKFNNWLKRG
jgi:NSS family neurotransmitter:Na+ symporter